MSMRLAAVLMCALLAGCSSSEVGFGTPVQPSPGAFPGHRETITGAVEVQGNGCIDLDLGAQGRRWIVWPEGTTTGGDGADIIVDDHAVTGADTLTGTGALATASVLPGWESEDSYFGGFGRFCSADDLGIVVFDDVAVAS